MWLSGIGHPNYVYGAPGFNLQLLKGKEGFVLLKYILGMGFRLGPGFLRLAPGMRLGA